MQYVINIPDHLPSSDYEVSWISVSSISFSDQLFEIYSSNPRSYQHDRCSPLTFEHWIGWHWQEDDAYICMLPNEKGYVVISQPDGKGFDACVSEWRASNIDAEVTLLKIAAAEIRRRYRRNSFFIQTFPQDTTFESLEWNTNDLVFEQNEDIIIRNIRLSDSVFEDIKRAYESSNGKALIWPGQYF